MCLAIGAARAGTVAVRRTASFGEALKLMKTISFFTTSVPGGVGVERSAVGAMESPRSVVFRIAVRAASDERATVTSIPSWLAVVRIFDVNSKSSRIAKITS